MTSKIILTDVDECVFDWAGPFEEWVRTSGEYGGDVPQSSLRDHWHVEAWLGCELDKSRQLIKKFNSDPQFWPHFEPLPGAKEVIGEMASEGWRFVAITACATDDWTWENRWANLHHHFGEAFDTLHCVGLHQSKAEHLARYRPTYWVEDKFSHAVSGADLGHVSFLVDYKHNIRQRDDRLIRVADWHEIRGHIEDRERGSTLPLPLMF